MCKTPTTIKSIHELPSESPSAGLLLWRRNNICGIVDAVMWDTVFTEAMSLPSNQTDSFSCWQQQYSYRIMCLYGLKSIVQKALWDKINLTIMGNH